MRRQGQYGDPTANTYVAARMHHVTGQRMEVMESKPGNFEGRLEAFTPERENLYVNSKPDGPWIWETDGPNMSNSKTFVYLMKATFLVSYAMELSVTKGDGRLYPMGQSGQGGDASRSYFQGQRPDPKLALQNRGNVNSRFQVQEEDMDVAYEGNLLPQTFEGLEQKSVDDIKKLTKEQSDAEDAENSRHREKINAINTKYEEKLASLWTQHASRRDEFLQRESHARQQQYQRKTRDPYLSSGIAPVDPYGYSAANNSSAPAGDLQRGYSAVHFDPYRERARFLRGGARDQGFEPRGTYPGGRVYDTGSRYYS